MMGRYDWRYFARGRRANHEDVFTHDQLAAYQRRRALKKRLMAAKRVRVWTKAGAAPSNPHSPMPRRQDRPIDRARRAGSSTQRRESARKTKESQMTRLRQRERELQLEQRLQQAQRGAQL
jgi:hypothetical protein